ncbi:tRNA (adenosine(37)-N6)-dimethylallyltransferase MiaA [Patescibacteria group bacterium]
MAITVNQNKLIVILGPTSSGKSGLAMKLVTESKGEIVIADSRQVYKDLNIGTSKPTPQDQQRVPHHLIDIKKSGDDSSVGEYKKLATETIKDIHKRKKTPFLVGGTGLYIDSITEGLEIPEVPPNLELRAELESKSLDTLVTELEELDYDFTEQVDRQNKRRLIRAIEVCRETGRKFSDLRQKKPVPFDILFLAIAWPREKLYQRIDDTVDQMMTSGLKQEIEGLLKKGVSSDWLINLGLEYRFITPVVQRTAKEAEAIQKLKYASHQFAKRQLTWFRRNKKIRWLKPAEAESKASELVATFLLS